MKIARALTIAGSDSGGGAGLQADLKTFLALGAYGMTAVTCVTAQNTQRVSRTSDVPADIVAEQIDVVAEDIGIDAAKTGMLSNTAIIEAVASALARNRITQLVVDPVMVSTSGDLLLREDAREALVAKLLPLAYLVTPNIPEAEVLTGAPIESIADMRDAAKRIHDLGPRHVLVKGGHLRGDRALDTWFDGTDFHDFDARRIETRNTHGSGCTYSAAITAFLAQDRELEPAIAAAKEYVTGAIAHGTPIGHGHGPLSHGWRIR